MLRRSATKASMRLRRFRCLTDTIANAMVDQHIGLEETDGGLWTIYFNTILLATFDERDYIITG